MKIRLFHKFVAVMLAVSLIPAALIGYRLIRIGQLGVKTAILELHLNMAERLAGELTAFADRVDGELRFAGDAIMKMDWDNKQALAASMLDSNPWLREFSVLSSEGREVIKVVSRSAKTGTELVFRAADPDFHTAMSSGKTVFRFENGNGKAPALVVFHPLNGKIALRAVADLTLSPALGELKRLGKTGFQVVLDSDARPIAYPQGLGAAELSDIAKWPISGVALSALASGSSEYKDAAGVSQIGSYAPIPLMGGAVIVKQSREEAFSYALFMQRQALYVVFFVLLFSLISAYFLSRQMTGPILDITLAAEKVAGGNFAETAPIKTRDELKDLGETFNKMVRQLKTYSEMQVDRIIREQKNTEAVLFSTEDGFVMIDGAGLVKLANRKARSVIGVSQTEPLEGRLLSDIIASEYVKGAVEEVLKSRKENFFKEITLELEYSRRTFKCFSAPIVAPEKGARLGTLLAFYDITLDKELERLKDEFLHSITHDLRNPMGAVKGFVEFMLKEIPGPINEAQRKMLVSIDRAAFRLLGMINNILDIAKMEAGKMELKLTEINVSEIAKRVLELYESLGQRKKIKFILEAHEAAVLQADAGLVERMFGNLIGNAVKFASDDGTITVRVERNEAMLTASVSDDGDGIPAEYLNRIFEKFEQVRGQKAGGTGLGLTICKHIAASHLGRIWVESEPGKGAKFIFTIPVNLTADETGKIFQAGGVK